MRLEGVVNIKPQIIGIDFPVRGKMEVKLKDGRIIIVPLKYFPSIKKLSMKQRRDWYVTDGELFSFEDSQEVFHVEQILGRESNYMYRFSPSSGKRATRSKKSAI
jgi:hypothetical protein